MNSNKGSPHTLLLPSRVNQTLSDRPQLRSFVSGSVSATCSTILFQPFDLVKTRIQKDDVITNHLRRSKMLSIVSHVVEKEHVTGLWRGTTPSLIRTVPGIGLYFMSVDLLTNAVTRGIRPPSAIEAGAIGVTARALAGVLLLPVTVLKTRYESGLFNYSSLRHALVDTYSREGLRGLFRGCGPTLLRDAPYSGLYYMFYSQLKQVVTKPHVISLLSLPSSLSSSSSSSSSDFPSINSTTSSRMCNYRNCDTIVTFSCGMSAGLLASLVTQPFDVLKTKIQLQGNKYGYSVVRATIIIFKNKGVVGFFDGMTPRILRRSLMSAISWTFFDTLTKTFSRS